ncbi:hypothetical protein C8A03DRAFT_42371 [Achaetomium macrosporum]|uniref:Uncharacterized protein n=1 Tax=Achaetomium macrosporum TaxID=79813 RepID=A0AAN7CE37_9PEZI|nr:hypothetical protein C8A03DRAFT_42371 [Achaetomium macrosporum]
MGSSGSGSRSVRSPHPAQDNPDSINNNRFIPLTADAKPLYWALSGPLSTSVWVMPEPFYDPDAPLEPYILGVSGADTSELHSVSQAPLTGSKISSAAVSVDVVNHWEDELFVMHNEHWDDCRWEEDWEPDEDVVRYGTLPGQRPECDDFPGREHLLRCCETDQPLNKNATLVVEAKGEFLTVHDFVPAVRPWLLALREDILAASGSLLDDNLLPPDTKLMAFEEKTWKVTRKRHPLASRLTSMSYK